MGQDVRACCWEWKGSRDEEKCFILCLNYMHCVELIVLWEQWCFMELVQLWFFIRFWHRSLRWIFTRWYICTRMGSFHLEKENKQNQKPSSSQVFTIWKIGQESRNYNSACFSGWTYFCTSFLTRQINNGHATLVTQTWFTFLRCECFWDDGVFNLIEKEDSSCPAA